MKHRLEITILIVILFLISQFIGLYINSLAIGQKELALGLEKPELNENTSFIYVFLLILAVTFIALLIAKFNAIRLLKIWFFISVVLVLTISLSFLINQKIAFILSLVAAYYKVVKPNVVIHNISELFLYAGLAVLFSENFNILTVSFLIILIAAYDMYSVWKSKHMVKLAKFQSKSKVFTGFLIPYMEKREQRIAMLGGGDIGFPLLFASVVMNKFGYVSLIIPFVVSFSLLLLLYFGEKNKFYPAMPFLGAGCFIGYGFVLLVI